MKKLLATSVLAATAFAGVSTPAVADVTANVGYASEYYYRGFFQKESSASAGIDFDESGYYLGTWIADVGDGLEYDLYTGYGFEAGDFSASFGVTGYYYTGDFDEKYEEVNLNLGYSFVSFEYSIGEYDGETDYDFAAVTFEYNGFYGTVGAHGVIEDDNGEGEYVELGYGTEVGGFDLGVALILVSDDITGDGVDEDEALVFTLGKSFDL